MPLLGLPSGCNAQAYNCCGFSCCRAWALDVRASVVVACGLSSTAPNSTTLQHSQLYNRMGRTRDLKKIRDTKGTFHADGHNKGQKWYGPNGSRRY